MHSERRRVTHNLLVGSDGLRCDHRQVRLGVEQLGLRHDHNHVSCRINAKTKRSRTMERTFSDPHFALSMSAIGTMPTVSTSSPSRPSRSSSSSSSSSLSSSADRPHKQSGQRAAIDTDKGPGTTYLSRFRCGSFARGSDCPGCGIARSSSTSQTCLRGTAPGGLE